MQNPITASTNTIAIDKQFGFSLLEPLIATAILAFAALSLSQLQFNSLMQMQFNRQKAHALYLASEILEKIVANKALRNKSSFPYDLSFGQLPPSSPSNCRKHNCTDPNALALAELNHWWKHLSDTKKLPNAQAQIEFDKQICKISIRWSKKSVPSINGDQYHFVRLSRMLSK